MPRSQFGTGRHQPPPFLNRDQQLLVVRRHVELLGDDPRHLKVFEVLGLGGVGKTRLLSELWQTASEQERTHAVLWVSLEAEASATEIGPLRSVREQLSVDCLLFDTALLTYWGATGQPFQVDRTSRIAGSLAFKSLELGTTFAGIALPLTFAADVYGSLSRRVSRARRYEKEEFEAIDDLRRDPASIRRRLPHYLGLDIGRKLDAERRSVVIFYDGYDKQAPATRSAGAPWLRELIGTLDRGVHVISSREPLRWDAGDWGGVLEPVRVGSLPESESREMIRARLGTLPAGVVDRLIAASRRIPFFLEATIDVYAARAQDADVGVADLPSSPEAAVAHLLDHLRPEHRSVAIALATVQVFDVGLYLHLVRSLNLGASVFEFEELTKWFFVEEVAPGLYRTHDLLTEFVHASSPEAPARRAALEAATSHLVARSQDEAQGDPAVLLLLFSAALGGWRSVREMPSASVEAMVDAGYRLYDAGYWAELAAMAPAQAVPDAHPIASIAGFFEALASRRTVGVQRALDLFERLEPRAPQLGRHEGSVELELAYLTELAGHYGRSRESFRRLVASATPFDPTDRTHLRSRLYHADMLIMDGEFEEGSRLLLETYEAVGASSRANWAELVRHRGHAFRFSFLPEQAESLYVQALQAAGDTPALLGKLHTNLVETRCWSEPPRALEAASVSVEINVRLGNQIELAKCDAAKAVALARMGETSAARALAETAVQQARKIGYPAGVAFGLQAGAVVDGIDGDTESLRAKSDSLRRTVSLLGTYGHLLAAPSWLDPDLRRFEEVVPQTRWLSRAELEARLREWLGPREPPPPP